MFKLLAGVLTNSTGVVKINGLFTEPHRRLDHIAWLPQESFLPPLLTTSQLLRLLPQPDDGLINLSTRPESRPLLGQRIGNLSVGERRFVELAIILNMKKPLLILDEPFTGLQPVTIQFIAGVIRELTARGHGLMVSDHQYSPVLEVCHRRMVLAGGATHDASSGKPGEHLLAGLYLPAQ